MVSDSLYSFPAQLASLPAMQAHARRCADGVQESVLLRLETALEELLTNTVVHGRGASAGDDQVWIGVWRQGGALLLRYEDAFAPFDPSDKIREALHRTGNPLEQRPVGGLGLLMVYRLADTFGYRREADHNRLDLRFEPRTVLV